MARVYRSNPASPGALRWLQWLLAQGKPGSDSATVRERAQSEAKFLGITKAQIARDLGVSPRAITHWTAPRGYRIVVGRQTVAYAATRKSAEAMIEDSDGTLDDATILPPDFREMPDEIAAKLDKLIGVKKKAIATYRKRIDRIDEIERFRPKKQKIPFRMYRYQTPMVRGMTRERSEIFVVDLSGLTDDEILGDGTPDNPGIIVDYYAQLKRDGRQWDVRYLAKIRTEDYFQGRVDDEIKSTIRGRAFMYMNIPADPTHRHFVKRLDQGAAIESATINDYIWREYGGRIMKILSVAFVPYKP